MKEVSNSKPAILNAIDLTNPYVVMGFPLTATRLACLVSNSVSERPSLFHADMPMMEGPAPVSTNPFSIKWPFLLMKGARIVESSSKPIAPSASRCEFKPVAQMSCLPTTIGSGKTGSSTTRALVRISAPSTTRLISTGPVTM